MSIEGSVPFIQCGCELPERYAWLHTEALPIPIEACGISHLHYPFLYEIPDIPQQSRCTITAVAYDVLGNIIPTTTVVKRGTDKRLSTYLHTEHPYKVFVVMVSTINKKTGQVYARCMYSSILAGLFFLTNQLRKYDAAEGDVHIYENIRTSIIHIFILGISLFTRREYMFKQLIDDTLFHKEMLYVASHVFGGEWTIRTNDEVMKNWTHVTDMNHHVEEEDLAYCFGLLNNTSVVITNSPIMNTIFETQKQQKQKGE